MGLIPGYDSEVTAGEGDWFDEGSAADAIGFFPRFLSFIEGERAEQPFDLEPWQQAVNAALFGWKRADGTRRYREALIYVPRKNGKTPWMAGLTDYVMFTDHEPGAQLYSAAADREQAAIIYRHASGMIVREPTLNRRARVYRTFKSIEYAKEGTIYKALSSDADTKHGLGAHLVVVDELHAHPNAELVDVLTTSTAARRQPLVIYITTADFARESVCNRIHSRACKVRDRIISDPSFLPVIYEADLNDDWTDPKVWARVNPNLGVSVKLDYLERECRRAREEPSYENTFKRLHLNIRTQQDVRWIPKELWDANDGAVDEGALAGKVCFAGLDLASTTDVAALCYAFPDENGAFTLAWRFFVPEEGIVKRSRRDGIEYDAWARDGWITATPGNVIDYGFIRKTLREDAARFRVQEIAYDPWNASQVAIDLSEQDGFQMVEFRQGFVSMNEPSKTFEKLLVAGKIRHGDNPVARWMASNAAIKTDPAGNIKPDKAKSTERIDGIVAAVMAIGRATTAPKPPTYDVMFL